MTSIEAVEQRYQERSTKIQRAADEEARSVREERRRGLEQVVEYAMDRRDLELAVRARDLLKADAPATRPAPATLIPTPKAQTAADLRDALVGTRWTCGVEHLQFQ